MAILIAFFSGLIRAGSGIRPLGAAEKAAVLTNTLALLYSFFILIFLIAFVANRLALLSVITAVWLCSNFIWIELNRRKKFFIASTGLLLFTDLFGFLVCWFLGKDAAFQYCYFASIGVPLMLLEKKKGLIIFFLFLSIACFVALEWMPDSIAKFGVVSKGAQKVFHAIMIFTVFLSTFSTIFYYNRANLQKEAALRKAILYAESINRQFKDAQETMIQSEKMVALGEMACGIAHEINTPLSAILMNAQFIQRFNQEHLNANPEIEKKAKAIGDISHRISKIIAGLKLFSSRDENEVFEYFSIARVVSGTLDLCHEKFKSHGIELRVAEIDPGLTSYGLPFEISQTLLNLLNNSYDAIQNLNEKWVSVQAALAGQHIEISITDSGPGISPEISHRIFDPFFTTKGPGKGTGLGLSISKGILQKHGGDMMLDPQSRHTCFRLRLPRVGTYGHKNE